MNPFKLALAASTALVGMSSLSYATVIADANNPITYASLTNWGTSTSDPSFAATDVFNFAGFNPSLGTLIGVVFTAKETVAGTITATNTGNSANFSAHLMNTLKLRIPTSPTSSTLYVSSTAIVNHRLAHDATYGPVTLTDMTGNLSSERITLSSNLTAFASPWSVTAGDLGYVAANEFGGNFTFASRDTGGIVLTAQYTYIPAPEPATVAVVGTGLAGLGLVRRRRKAP